jgi:hypothetical protein
MEIIIGLMVSFALATIGITLYDLWKMKQDEKKMKQ